MIELAIAFDDINYMKADRSVVKLRSPAKNVGGPKGFCDFKGPWGYQGGLGYMGWLISVFAL